MAKRSKRSNAGRPKARMSYDQSIELINELGDHLNTFSLAILNEATEDDLRKLIINRTSGSGFIRIKQIGYQLATHKNPVDAINLLRAQLADAIHN